MVIIVMTYILHTTLIVNMYFKIKKTWRSYLLRKIAKFILPLFLSISFLSGCGANAEVNGTNKEAAANSSTTNAPKETTEPAAPEQTGYVPETLTVQFVPSQNADTLEAKAKPLEKLLTDQLGIPVKVSVSTDYNVIIEAMASKK